MASIRRAASRGYRPLVQRLRQCSPAEVAVANQVVGWIVLPADEPRLLAEGLESVNKVCTKAIDARAACRTSSQRRKISTRLGYSVDVLQCGQPGTGTSFSTGSSACRERQEELVDFSTRPTIRVIPTTSWEKASFGLSALTRQERLAIPTLRFGQHLLELASRSGKEPLMHWRCMAGKTFYTGADGKKRPDNVKGSYSGQAGNGKLVPFLLPKGAYNHAAEQGVYYNYLFAAGGKMMRTLPICT